MRKNDDATHQQIFAEANHKVVIALSHWALAFLEWELVYTTRLYGMPKEEKNECDVKHEYK